MLPFTQGGGVVHVSLYPRRRCGACYPLPKEEVWCMLAFTQGGGVVHVTLYPRRRCGACYPLPKEEVWCMLASLFVSTELEVMY